MEACTGDLYFIMFMLHCPICRVVNRLGERNEPLR
jgi:hypothetical protein